ncbi:MAG: thioredoxin family protein [Gemmatimonadetes bacterium]|nr:thioredoxin family protein [Gemmatimonadota bacterium]
MLLPFVVATLAAVAPLPSCESVTSVAGASSSPTAAVDSTLNALYASGVEYRTFLANAVARKAQWVKNTDASLVPADMLAVAQALPGRWRILVSAIDGCSDSVNTVPYIARLVELVPSLEMRIVLPDAGKPIMESHRTPDGRPATPTVVILDEAGRDVGCWVERPAFLQSRAIAARAAGLIDQFAREKQSMYDGDAGASTVREVVAVLQAAAAGKPRCDAGPAPLPSDAPSR